MIKILIDSASDIVQEEAIKKGIEMIPMEVRFKDEVYYDGVNLSHIQFFEKLIESDELPKTSLINEFRFEEKMEEMIQGGNQLLVITISSKLSGTYDAARAAAKKFKDQVYVLDSLSATAGERILCDYALELIKQNKNFQEIQKELEAKKRKIQILAVVDTLKYLRKGGRISSITAFAGEMFSIKPVISVIDGEVKVVGKARGSKKSNNLLMELVNQCGGIDFKMPYGALYSGLSKEYLNKYLVDSEILWKDYVRNMNEIPTYMIGSTIGTHVGPNAIGVTFFSKS